MQDQIYASFMGLWPSLKPGGLYFIEDLQVSRSVDFFLFRGERKSVAMQDYLHNWMGKLLSWYRLFN